jgi:7-carboxy-7-deazaguanine synthase
MSLLKVSEIFQSLQGEGASSGELASFLRLATCNLRCGWCDTKYTWDFEQYDYDREVTLRTHQSVAAELERALPRRLVITGGEPMLQQAALADLLRALGDVFFVELETNGTLAPSPELLVRIDQWNVSPKLSNSGNPPERCFSEDALIGLLGSGRSWLKLVVTSEADLEEADALVARLAWPKSRVLLMPEATTREALRRRSGFVRTSSHARGYGFSDRLHLELWDGRRGT